MSEEKKIEKQKWICSKHGEVKDTIMSLKVISSGGKMTDRADYCFLCFMEFLDKNVGRIEKI